MVSIPHGYKMIEVRLRFWTNNTLSEEENELRVPGHCWNAGVVIVSRNDHHNIQGRGPTPFHSIEELPEVLHEEMAEAGITIRT